MLVPEHLLNVNPIETFPDEGQRQGFAGNEVRAIESEFDNSTAPRDPSSFAMDGVHPQPDATNGARDETEFLPIKAWYLGRKQFKECYCLVWEDKGRMTIRSGASPGVPSRHTEEVDLRSIAKEVWFGDPNEDWPDKVFVVETEEETGRDKIGLRYSEFFTQGGKHGEGDKMIKFDTSSSAWSGRT